MAWCRPGDKPLSEAMMVSVLTHICVARPQWVNAVHWQCRFVILINSLRPSDAYMRQWLMPTLVERMACRLNGAKPSEPMLGYCQLDSWEQISVKFESKFHHFHSRKCFRNCRLPRCQPFCPGGDELIQTMGLDPLHLNVAIGFYFSSLGWVCWIQAIIFTH